MGITIGSVIGGRYVVDTILGHGSFATVYGVRHAWLGSAHALKVLHAGVDAQARQRLAGEGRIQARLAHPNVVRVTDVVELPDGVALVMDRVDGETLRQLLDRGRPPVARVRAIADGLLDGLAAAHAAGLIHRDLKPENVLLGADGIARTTDFGLARAADPALRGALTVTGTGLGTPGYMAPEAFTHASTVDHRADIFSLGAVLYELCSGERPFPARLPVVELLRRAQRATYEPLDERVPSLPLAVAEVVHSALEPDPGSRTASVAALAAGWRQAWAPA